MDNDQIPILPEKQISQMAINQKTLRFVRANPDKFGALLWIKPATEGCTAKFEALVAENRDLNYGLKVHPYHSKISFGSPEVEKYMRGVQANEVSPIRGDLILKTKNPHSDKIYVQHRLFYTT